MRPGTRRRAAVAFVMGFGGGCGDKALVDDSSNFLDTSSSGETGPSGETGDTATEPALRARWSGDVDLGGASAVTWLGEGAGDRLGRTVTGAGDFDGDGALDALIGAYYRSEGYSRNGEAWLLLGPAAGWSADGTADLSVLGEQDDAFVSRGMAGVGDLSGDGLDDLLIGAPNHEVGAGRVCLFLGGAGGGVVALGEGDACIIGDNGLFGAFVSGPGDMSGDGVADALVSPIFDGHGGESAGAVVFVEGPLASGEWSAPDLPTLTGQEQDNAGWSSAGAGDLDGDGLNDAWVGRPGADDGAPDGGAVALLLGAPAGDGALIDAPATVVGDAELGRAGTSVAGGQDLDGDGAPDLLIGVPGQAGGVGAGVVVMAPPVSGTLELSAASASWAGEAAGGQAGWGVALVGDLDGDGLGEALIGAFGGEGSENEGTVALLYGPPAAGAHAWAEADARFHGGEVGDFAGWFVAGPGDLDGDGGADLLIGAQRSDAGGEEAGRAHMVPGAAW